MAAEARAESPAPAAPPLPVPEKRTAAEEDDEEERPGPKRRRASVATLDGVACTAAALEGGHRDGSSFSFQHGRGGFVALETTPKFGSFNPPEQQDALDPKPAPPHAGEDSPVAAEEEEDDDAASPHGARDREDENSQLAAATEVDQGEPERQDESE